MPIHSVIITNIICKNILFSKYYNDTFIYDHNQILSFEHKLMVNIEPYCKRLKNDLLFTITIDSVYVVFQQVGELLVFICGTNDIDETICKSN
jgi:hypothetical protein